MNKSIVSLIVCSSLVLTSCGGRTPAPVMVSQYGDSEKSCKALEFEMGTVQAEINRLLPETSKTGKNVVLGVAGAFLLVPWFFMDFTNAEQAEYEAYRQRYNNLAALAISKNCSIQAVNYPSAEEIAKEKAHQEKAGEPTSVMTKS